MEIKDWAYLIANVGILPIIILLMMKYNKEFIDKTISRLEKVIETNTMTLARFNEEIKKCEIERKK